MAKDTKQVVEVVFPSGGKTYSYIGSGDLRVGQEISNAPVNHYRTNTPYSAPVKVVATHNVYGVNVGDRVGVSNGVVHSIPKPLKYLPGNKALTLDRTIDINGRETTTQDYMQPYKPDMARERLVSAFNTKKDNTIARNQLLGV